MLAARVVMDQGVEVVGVTFVMAFASRDTEKFKANVEEAARGAGIPVRIEDISDRFLELVRSPRHGFGANMNPCIDCKILMLRSAKKMMKAEGADFVMTGEVLGERPMSQNRDALNTIKKYSELEGYLLRPLSAKLLDETVPEREGLVDREKLLDLQGRSRKRQYELAKEYNLTKFFAPGGGCLLTDPIFVRKLKDLVAHDGRLDPDEIALLKYGRHFRLDAKTKAVVGRDERDNEELLNLKKDNDVVLRLQEKAGPYVILRGDRSKGNIEKAASLALSHSKFRNGGDMTIEFWSKDGARDAVEAKPMTKDRIEKLRI